MPNPEKNGLTQSRRAAESYGGFSAALREMLFTLFEPSSPIR
jgi:hypothetical protein